MGSLIQDIQYGLRMLRKSPGLALVVALTLGLGIGANTVMFSIVNGFLRPLPVPAPQQIMALAAQQKGGTVFNNRFSYSDLVDFRKQADTFSDLFGFVVGLAGLSSEGHADHFVVSYVTGNYFSALGVKPALGRLFLPGEGEMAGDSPYVVLGYAYWQRRFGGDPGIVGKQVLINGKSVTIIGVSEKGFLGTYAMVAMDGYAPFSEGVALGAFTGEAFTNRRTRILRVLGRVKPGVSLAQAQSSANVIAERLARQFPAENIGMTVRVIPDRLARPEAVGNNIVPIIAGLFLVLAGLVLLLACINVANLLLVRATIRFREMGIRAALGASRTRLLRQMLTETSLLALLGGAAGLLMAAWVGPGLVESKNLGSGIPIRLDFSFDARVFLYALVAVVFTAILVGMWPALRAARADVSTVLHEGGRSDLAGAGRQRVRNILVVAQVAGSLMLLIVAGLFARTLQSAQRMYLGFDPDHLLNATVNPSEIGFDEPRAKEFYRELVARVRALPGVQSAALALSVPLSGLTDANSIYVEGHPVPAGQQPPFIFYNHVDPAYFDTTHVPLLRGRAFAESDDETSTQVAIVNQSMASRFWPNEDPIGKRFSLKSDAGPFLQVVGVAGDGKYIFIAEDPQPYFYVPLKQCFVSMRTLQIRTSVAPESLTPQVREEIRKLAPDLPIFNLQTMKETLEGGNGFFIFRAGAERAAQMGILGFILAVVGIFGVVSYAVAQRTHEIGIRMALGADRRNILKLVLGQGVGLVVAGVCCGLVAAWAVTRATTKLFVGVSSMDPITYVAATLLLAAVALLACYIPAFRATRVDPMIALRHE
jgi:predicted permease